MKSEKAYHFKSQLSSKKIQLKSYHGRFQYKQEDSTKKLARQISIQAEYSVSVSTCTVNTHHGQSIILSLQKADGSCCSAWACGMLTKRARLEECTTATLLIIHVIYVENEIHIFLLSRVKRGLKDRAVRVEVSRTGLLGLRSQG